MDSPRPPDPQTVAAVKRKRVKWYGGGLRFACTQCGDCCSGDPGYVWATKEEIRRIARLLGRPDDWLDRKHLRRVGFRYSLTEQTNGDCIFLQRKGGTTRCGIYAERPLQCRTWPFWSGNLSSPTSWRRASDTCPGMNNGTHYEFVQIETIRTRKR